MCVEGFEEAEIQRPADFAVGNPSRLLFLFLVLNSC
jgi:hypothetical protein